MILWFDNNDDNVEEITKYLSIPVNRRLSIQMSSSGKNQNSHQVRYYSPHPTPKKPKSPKAQPRKKKRKRTKRKPQNRGVQFRAM